MRKEVDVVGTVAAAEQSEAAPEGGPGNVNRFGQSESSMSLKIIFLGGSNFRETPVN